MSRLTLSGPRRSEAVAMQQIDAACAENWYLRDISYARTRQQVKRREFIAVVGGAAVTWPFAANAQQPAMPVIGFMSGRSPEDSEHLVAAFRQGLGETGFVEGQNVSIEVR